MAAGTLIAESLRLNIPLQHVPLDVAKITRIGPLTDLSANQPTVWTFIEFSVRDDLAPALAETLAQALDPAGGWYCDFRTEQETFVVFADRVFRYGRGDPAGRERAAACMPSSSPAEACRDYDHPNLLSWRLAKGTHTVAIFVR
jgi:hypothetical protein